MEAGRETVIKIAKLGVRDYLIKPFEGGSGGRTGGPRCHSQCQSQQASDQTDHDPINILLVDDKPAIAGANPHPLGRYALAYHDRRLAEARRWIFAWRRESTSFSPASPSQTTAVTCSFSNLRGYNGTSAIPIIGLCIKTAVEEQTRAQQTGFSSVVTKPIDPDDLKAKITRALKLDTSYKYFQQREGWLALTLPKALTSGGHPGCLQAAG